MKLDFMKNMRREVVTGIVVLISLGVLYWGLNFLKGVDIFSTERSYYAVYEKIEGLTVSNPVQINGFTVGSVREINFHPDNSGRIVVRFALTGDVFELPKYTAARIASLDLLGGKSIKLVLGKDSTFHKVGDTLRSSIEGSIQEEVNKQIIPLKNKAEQLISSMDTVINTVQAILNKEARDNLSASFESVKNALATFEVVALRMDTMIAEHKEKFGRIMVNIESISDNLRQNNERITDILENIDQISDSIAASNITETINNAGKAFEDAALIIEKIERGEGTLGQLVNNDSLYNYLQQSARDLDLLLIDLQQHPNRYVHVSVFGRKDKEQKRMEKEQKKAARKE